MYLCLDFSLGWQVPEHFHHSKLHMPSAALRAHFPRPYPTSACPHTFLIWLGVLPTTSSPKPETSFLSSPSHNLANLTYKQL